MVLRGSENMSRYSTCDSCLKKDVCESQKAYVQEAEKQVELLIGKAQIKEHHLTWDNLRLSSSSDLLNNNISIKVECRKKAEEGNYGRN
jgi:hypothetical protein